MRLKNKNAIVVGAGQIAGTTVGNGKAISLLFAREGASVLCVDKNMSAAEETVKQIRDEGGTAHAHEADITIAGNCEHIATVGRSELGSIDILVNNVGIGAGDNIVDQLAEDDWDRILNTNLKGMWLTMKHVLPVMRDQGFGNIINISSMASVLYAQLTAYEISKAAVNKLTQSTAAGYAKHGIRCNAILPGLLDTPMAIEGIAAQTGQDAAAVRKFRNALVPLGRKMGDAWDTAYAALFLASDEAKFITGIALPVDGALSLGAR